MIKIKQVQLRKTKQAMVCFSKAREAQKTITEIKWYKGCLQKYTGICIIKTAVAKFPAYLKINKNKHKKQNRKKFRKLEMMKNDIKKMKICHNEQKLFRSK